MTKGFVLKKYFQRLQETQVRFALANNKTKSISGHQKICSRIYYDQNISNKIRI